ncbi:MAG: bifunctional [glutamate--ammonia ligase]-adenylyl-L-tyrosine phosphorylase/[glutamate--ammonia-ligase] adenylyltransferase [Deltaproteobacteria bacterium]|nr:bifunctional [glutamate--ammonia ligase]-adenylyl-L-tyrosine phosphorylase/[glutamate--ammonia-ligase] adenylyltransferase [Deltaproteobacteria bacterium]MBW2661153.1 bifunctional [glutamate--ammonia ligase]-adenylyl-L-tyrosine phosphorylase/[glutamate--ammonia-ligase] adenylyltransferase [Deltaproteobacteria bacterium]
MKLTYNLPELLSGDFNNRWKDFCLSAKSSNITPSYNSEMLAALKQVFAFSDFAARTCIHHPDILDNLIKSNDLQQRYIPDNYNNRLKKLLPSSGSIYTLPEMQHILRLFRLREMVRIAWRDLTGWADLDETMADLSTFADSCIKHTLLLLHEKLCQEYGTPTGISGAPQYLVVIGMGKLGACELNFSSDIDLIFAFPEAGKTKGKSKSISNEDFFMRLGRNLLNVIGTTTSDGLVFRMDMRLRPYGESGPLVMNFDNIESYYQRQGREWERYAWIKARIIADDNNTGSRLLKILKPFVYRRYLDFGVFDSLRNMKQKIHIEAHRKGLKNSIKLGPGGIREIEFFGQIFQLIRGGVTPALQKQSIQKTLTVLSQKKYIHKNVCDELIKAYRFLRNTEHRLQEFSDQQTHRLPSDLTGKIRLAASMGFRNWESFAKNLKNHMDAVHYHFDALLSTKDAEIRTDSADKKLTGLQSVWLNLVEKEKAGQILFAAGFDIADRVFNLLDNLRNDQHTQKLSIEGRKRLDKLMPFVLKEVGKSEHPHTVLSRIIDLIKTIERRTCYIALLLENPSALTHLINLSNASPWIVSFLSHHPVLLDELLDPRTLYSPPDKNELEKEVRKKLDVIQPEDLEYQIQELCIFKQINMLRVGAADVTGSIKLMKTSDHLTELAETIVDKVLELAWNHLIKKYGIPDCEIDGEKIDRGFVVIAYGKLGGIELGYGSDLDLVFLHAGTRGQTHDGIRPLDNSQFFARLGQRIIHILTAHTPAGALYETDTRLRPSGSSGILVTHIEAFRDYQVNKAWTWEHQALVRARAISGNIYLAKYFEQIRKDTIARPRIQAKLKKESCDMRERMRKKYFKPMAESFDLKQDTGGIVDIEFMVQYLVLLNSYKHNELLKWTDNVRLLQTLAETGVINKHTAHLLKDAYLNYRKAVHSLSLQKKPAIVPENQFHDLRKQTRKIWKELMN